MELIGHVIGGQEGPASDGDTFETIDPWTRRPWARVARGTRQDVDRAVAAARLAFDQGPWPRMGYERRGRLLHRLGELIEAHVDELARADTTDMGKPISVMREADVPRAAHNFRFFADHARMRPSEVFPMDSGHHAYVRYDPAGVVAAIAPWNFPLMLETWKIAPALAWGNTVVLKPAEDSPASATLLARLAMEAGFPEGVLNVVHGFGPDAAGQWLTESPGVDRITFTGESATGRAIARAGAGNLVPVSLELGGKGANLVFADADLDVAVPWSIRAIFSNSGQVCLAGSRLFVERGIYDEFMDRFVTAADAMVLGNPAEAGTQLGDGDALRRRGRGCRARQRHALRPQRHAVHREPAPRPPGQRRAPGGHRVGQLLLHPRPAGAVRRCRGLRLGPGGRRLQPRVLHRAQGRGDGHLSRPPRSPGQRRVPMTSVTRVARWGGPSRRRPSGPST